MSKRKQYIIDKKFQLKTTLTIIGSIFLVVALLTVLLIFNIVNVNNEIKTMNKSINQTNEEISNIIEIEDNIVQVLSVPNPEMNKLNQKMSIEIAQHHNSNMKMLRNRIKNNVELSNVLQKRLNTNFILLSIVIVIVLLQGIIFFFVLIRQTHKIAGPVYVMSLYMKQIINGTIPQSIRKLRDTDQLQDFYALFNQMVKNIAKLKNNNKKQ